MPGTLLLSAEVASADPASALSAGLCECVGSWRILDGKPSVKCIFTIQCPRSLSVFRVLYKPAVGATCIKVVLFLGVGEQCLLAFLFSVTVSRAALNCIGYCRKLSRSGFKGNLPLTALSRAPATYEGRE